MGNPRSLYPLMGPDPRACTHKSGSVLSSTNRRSRCAICSSASAKARSQYAHTVSSEVILQAEAQSAAFICIRFEEAEGTGAMIISHYAIPFWSNADSNLRADII